MHVLENLSWRIFFENLDSFNDPLNALESQLNQCKVKNDQIIAPEKVSIDEPISRTTTLQDAVHNKELEASKVIMVKELKQSTWA